MLAECRFANSFARADVLVLACEDRVKSHEIRVLMGGTEGRQWYGS